MTNTFERVRKTIADHVTPIPGLTITEATTLAEMEIDSLDRIEMIFAIESEFGFDITDETIATLVTVGDLVALVESATEGVAP